MFTNSFSINPFPRFPSSSYPPLYLNHDNSETFLHDPMAVPFIPGDNNVYSIPQTTINFTVNDCKLNEVNGDHYGMSGLLGRKPVKKDRHSKICTAQGFRDRRVRLSIEIARKFFDLQDMLGFDKASKTLDWLLKHSKKAIQELALEKQSYGGGAKSLSSPSECKVVSGIKDCEDPAERFHSSIRSLLVEVNEDKPLKRTLYEIAKESRAKARARARERTRDKMSTRFHDSSSSRVPQVFPNSSSAEAGTEKSAKSVAEIENLADTQVTKEKFLEDPIVIKRKSLQSFMLNPHQNPMISEDARHNSCISPNCIPNWNVGGATSRTSLCAATDMNLTTCLYQDSLETHTHTYRKLSTRSHDMMDLV